MKVALTILERAEVSLPLDGGESSVVDGLRHVDVR